MCHRHFLTGGRDDPRPTAALARLFAGERPITLIVARAVVLSLRCTAEWQSETLYQCDEVTLISLSTRFRNLTSLIRSVEVHHCRASADSTHIAQRVKLLSSAFFWLSQLDSSPRPPGSDCMIMARQYGDQAATENGCLRAELLQGSSSPPPPSSSSPPPHS